METTLLRGNGRLLPLFLLLLAAADFTAVQGQGQGQQQQAGAGGAYYSQSFSPSMAIVIVVLIAAFFFLGFFSIYVRHCYGDSSSSYSTNPAPNGAAARSRRQPRGLDAAVLESFPTMAYADVKAHKAGKGALECAVCLSEFDDDETLRLLPKCSHVFHSDCIDTWLASHVTCPVCRANLVPDANANSTPADDAPELLPPAPAQELPSPTSAPPPAAAAAAAVVIDVEETEEERIIREEADELMRIGSVKRALRSKSGRAPAARFPRSHSTGHSLAAPGTAGAGTERFTLRLPDHVLRDLAAAGKLQRTTSLLAFRSSRGGSTRRGVSVRAGAGGEGSSRAGRSIRLGQSGRWPSFLARTFSARLPAWGSRSTRRGVETDGSSKGGRAAGAAGAGAKSVEQDDQAYAPGQRV